MTIGGNTVNCIKSGHQFSEMCQKVNAESANITNILIFFFPGGHNSNFTLLITMIDTQRDSYFYHTTISSQFYSIPHINFLTPGARYSHFSKTYLVNSLHCKIKCHEFTDWSKASLE